MLRAWPGRQTLEALAEREVADVGIVARQPGANERKGDERGDQQKASAPGGAAREAGEGARARLHGYAREDGRRRKAPTVATKGSGSSI